MSSIIFAGIVYYTERTLPALHDVVKLIYVLLIGIVTFATIRWIRARRANRREGDRRRRDRRSDTPD